MIAPRSSHLLVGDPHKPSVSSILAEIVHRFFYLLYLLGAAHIAWTYRIYISTVAALTRKASWVKRKTTTGWSKVSPPKQDGENGKVGGLHVEILWKLGSLHLVISSIRTTIQKKLHVRYSTCRHTQANGSKYATHGYVWAIQFTTHLPFAEFRGSSYESWLLILDKRPTEITYMTLGPGDMEGQTFCQWPKNFRNILQSVLFDILVNKHGN